MGIPVKLQVFEGPLDLLLHLIDKNKIDIYDIPIVEITNQYMEYIDAMEKEIIRICEEETFGADDCIKYAKNFDVRKKYREYLKLYGEIDE